MSNVDPQFISNAPCGEDLLEGLPHQRIAEQLSELLEEKKRFGSFFPHLIGLDGKWGSGKSNIIAMAKKMAKGHVLFFTYNVWGHQSDPLRRSILEELTAYVVRKEGALASNEMRTVWKKKLKSLLSTRKEVDTKTTPKVSAGILFWAGAILLTPTCSTIGDTMSRYPRIIVTALPLAFAILYSLVGLSKIKGKHYYLKLRLKRWCDDLFSLYREHPKREVIHEAISSSEATSTQFKEWIKELDKALQHPLAIVFDDIDRLPASKVQEFWAAIHTLFSNSDDGEASPRSYQHICVIVPFDRQHIIAAFKEENISAGGIPGESTPPCRNISDKANVENAEDDRTAPSEATASSRCYGNDFIEKTFDAIFRVPPPILSNWKEYLSDHWNEAFSKEPDGSITLIYDHLTEHSQNQDQRMRDIVAFVNECVSIRRTCDPEIPNEYIALFAVGKHRILANPQQELLELSFCAKLLYKYDNEETRINLVAIYYNLEPKRALEVVYVKPLASQLVLGNPDLLKMLILVSPRIANHIMESAITLISNARLIKENDKFILTSPIHSVVQAIFLAEKYSRITALKQNTFDQLSLKSMVENGSERQVSCNNGEIEDPFDTDYHCIIVNRTSKERRKEHLKALIRAIAKEFKYGRASSNKVYASLRTIYLSTPKESMEYLLLTIATHRIAWVHSSNPRSPKEWQCDFQPEDIDGLKVGEFNKLRNLLAKLARLILLFCNTTTNGISDELVFHLVKHCIEEGLDDDEPRGLGDVPFMKEGLNKAWEETLRMKIQYSLNTHITTKTISNTLESDPGTLIQFLADTETYKNYGVAKRTREMTAQHLRSLEVEEWLHAFKHATSEYKVLIALWQDNPNAHKEVPKAYEAFKKMVQEGDPFGPGVQEELARLFTEQDYQPPSR